MRKAALILFAVFGFVFSVNAQENKIILLPSRIIDGDTLPYVYLPELEVYALQVPRSFRKRKKLSRLVKNVKRVYPYARLAAIQLHWYDRELVEAQNDRERRKIMKKAEKEIKERYGGELRKLNFSQGLILIKLIDRETGETSYDLVEGLRGSFTAFFYQAFARLWGYNLKIKYDPDGEDRQIETIVRMIERGQI
ncbi:MAG: DUF4294 domain-containing protein [Bacteroidales bacterium]|nr:DUF4294 domain-containing protein [Bacteroidales bacterium]MCF6342980.1 DUF4294 domain-containing protein [Bacteroidales bacterium]